MVERNEWIDAEEFEHAVATTNLLPGPASTQLAIYCGWRLRAVRGGLVAGLGFIAPGLVLILALAALFLVHRPPLWITGLSLGASAAIPAVALRTATQLGQPSLRRVRPARHATMRWLLYAAAGALCAMLFDPLLVVVIVGAGLVEVVATRRSDAKGRATGFFAAHVAVHAATLAGLGALSWVAFKVGALSYGGGFVIVPLMQHDVVTTYHWMSGARFLDAVVLGQVTPGPVVLTVAAVGYAARGVVGGLVATVVAFAPSFVFVLGGAPHFERLRANATARSFLAGAGPCVIGAIAGSAVPLGLLLTRLWQLPVLLGAALWLFPARRGALSALALSGVAGLAIVLLRSHA